MNGFRLPWVTLHLTPLVVVPLTTHAFNRVIGLNAAAAIALITVIATIAYGQSRLVSGTRVTSSRWMWQTACAVGLAVAAGLVVMSTIDLAGYDTLATFGGMTTAGVVLGAIQAPMLAEGRLRWIGASAAGWLIGALVFRNVIASLAAMSVAGLKPYGLAYNAGHNELLWTATGLAFYGFATAATRLPVAPRDRRVTVADVRSNTPAK